MPVKEGRIHAILDDDASKGLVTLGSAIGTVGINIALLARHFGKGNEAMMQMFTLLFTIGHLARATGAVFRLLTSETVAQTLANWGLASSFAGVKAVLGDPTGLILLAGAVAATAAITATAMGAFSPKAPATQYSMKEGKIEMTVGTMVVKNGADIPIATSKEIQHSIKKHTSIPYLSN